MSNDKNADHRPQSDMPQQSSRESQHEDTLSEKSFSPKKDLLFEDDLEHLGSFSLDGLRSNFPDPDELVRAIWVFLPWNSRIMLWVWTVICLSILNELVQHIERFWRSENGTPH